MKSAFTSLRPALVALAGLFAAPLAASHLELISKPAAPAPRSFGDSSAVELSADGRWAAFVSNGNGLATNDHNGLLLDLFLRDLQSGVTTLVSRALDGSGGDGHSVGTSLSPDGRWLLFESDASNLVAGDDNDSTDVFLYDRDSRQLTALSRTLEGFQVGDSGAATMTPDGRFILFESFADSLSPLDTNGAPDLYLLDRQSGGLQLITVNSNNTAAANYPFANSALSQFEGGISDDGRYVAFISYGLDHAPHLPFDTRVLSGQIYLRDTLAGTNIHVSRTATNNFVSLNANSPMLSPDGAFLSFVSSNLVAGLGPIRSTTYLHRYDIATATLTRLPFPDGLPGFTYEVLEPHQAAVGGRVSFVVNNQVYLNDPLVSTSRLVSATTNPIIPASGTSDQPQISANGRIITFLSNSTNLAGTPLSSDSTFQLFRFDVETGLISLLSRSIDDTSPMNNSALFPELSEDGSMAGFTSFATDAVPGDDPAVNDVFAVRTSGSDPAVLVSAPSPEVLSSTAAGLSSVQGASLSLDGRFVAFSSFAPDIVTNDFNHRRDVFLHDRQTGRTKLVSAQPDGVTPLLANSSFISMSADGSAVAFLSSNRFENASFQSVYLHDAASGSNTLASILPNGTPAFSADPACLSANGRVLAFKNSSQGQVGIYARDLASSSTLLLTNSSRAVLLGISPSGALVAMFEGSSLAISDSRTGSRHVITNSSQGFYGFTAEESLVLHASRDPSGLGDVLRLTSVTGDQSDLIASGIGAAALSADGSTIVYQIRSLPAEQAANLWKIAVYNVAQKSTEFIAPLAEGAELRLRGGFSVSGDGRFITFASESLPATGDDENGLFTDVFLYDRARKAFSLISCGHDGHQGDLPSGSPVLSADGRVLLFDSSASSLVENDLNTATDVFAARLTPPDADQDGLDDVWETAYFNQAGADPAADSDGDGASNADEFRAGTIPTNAASRLAIQSIELGAEGGVVLAWTAVYGRSYQLQYRSTLGAGAWQDVGQPVVALTSTASVQTLPSSSSLGFFRLNVN